MNTTKVLFICSASVDRSPTAEYLYASYPGIETKSAGISMYTRKPVIPSLLDWADVVFCMGNYHKQYLTDKFPQSVENKEINVLGISDNYTYGEPALEALIKEKMAPWLLQFEQTRTGE